MAPEVPFAWASPDWELVVKLLPPALIAGGSKMLKSEESKEVAAVGVVALELPKEVLSLLPPAADEGVLRRERRDDGSRMI